MFVQCTNFIFAFVIWLCHVLCICCNATTTVTAVVVVDSVDAIVISIVVLFYAMCYSPFREWGQKAEHVCSIIIIITFYKLYDYIRFHLVFSNVYIRFN